MIVPPTPEPRSRRACLTKKSRTSDPTRGQGQKSRLAKACSRKSGSQSAQAAEVKGWLKNTPRENGDL
jgi:hypothetical protein